MFVYQDKFNISLPLAVYLCHDKYDYNSHPHTISATSLMKPIREIVLARQNKDLDKVIDISQLISSRMGSSIHDGAEEAWRDPKAIHNALEAKGMLGIEDRIVVNPDNLGDLPPGMIPVYLENRSEKAIEDFIVSGKYDIVYGGQLSDYKSTSVWGYVYGSNIDDYRRQGSIYRWLNPKIITKETIEIQYIFTDWSAVKAKQSPDYPAAKYLTATYPLFSYDETEEWIRNRLKEVSRNLPLEQLQLPKCTKEELWQTDDVYKYFKNPQNVSRATKNFSDKLAAESYMMDQGGVGRIDTVEGQVKRCKYCSVVGICDQAAMFIEQGVANLD